MREFSDRISQEMREKKNPLRMGDFVGVRTPLFQL
jgi:hypothetical protein